MCNQANWRETERLPKKLITVKKPPFILAFRDVAGVKLRATGGAD
jgi:hypothetical protein